MTVLSGRTAFITGGGQGIGLGIARACVTAGMKVAVVDVDKDALRGAEAELSNKASVVALELDVCDRDAYRRTADMVEERLGPVALLCNNAGISGQVPVTQMTYEAWDWVLGVDLNGVYNGIQTFVPRMIERGGGTHVVNTASVAGLLGNPGFLYATAKYGVVGLSESLKIELMPYDIGVSVLCPSAVATDIIDHTFASAPKMESGGTVMEGSEEYFKPFRTRLARGANPDDVGKMVLDAVQQGQLFILTDDILGPYLEERTAAIIAAMPSVETTSREQ